MKTKKTILIFNNSFGVESESFVIEHVKQLLMNHNVDVLCHEQLSPLFEKQIKLYVSGIQQTIFGRWVFVLKNITKNPSLVRFLNPIKYKRDALNLSLFHVAAFLIQSKYDLIYSHFGTNAKMMQQVLDELKIDTPHIGHFHGMDFTVPLYSGSYYDSVNKSLKNIISGTNFCTQSLVKLGFSEHHISQIPAVINSDLFQRSQPYVNHKIHRLIFVGRLITLKGVLELPKIASALIAMGRRDFQIVIIGFGPLKNELLELIKGLEEFIILKDRMSQSEIKNELEQASIALYPGVTDAQGREENQCIALAEALSMELPSIATDVGGISDTIIHGETGILVPQKQPELFAKAIIALLEDYPKRLKLGQNGRQHILQRYAADQVFLKLEKLYTSIY